MRGIRVRQWLAHVTKEATRIEAAGRGFLARRRIAHWNAEVRDPQQGLHADVMALIASDCDAMLTSRIKWP